jgi:hypothetical protein
MKIIRLIVKSSCLIPIWMVALIRIVPVLSRAIILLKVWHIIIHSIDELTNKMSISIIFYTIIRSIDANCDVRLIIMKFIMVTVDLYIGATILNENLITISID